MRAARESLRFRTKTLAHRKSSMTPKNSPTVFTSYAQNFEDVVLWRALKHVSNGFYVDIGAQHPVLDSVSKAFYEHGWRGVHVEPVPHYAEMIRQDRPDEQVLQLALSDEPGILELHVIENSGLSTAVKVYAEGYEKDHGFAHTTIQTPMLPMKSALAFLADRTVHWLKIDVEGLEEQVLRGWDSTVLRPWIIVIEATVPMSPELRYEGAEKLILTAGYRFAYFDGLNRYYVANEHAELIPSLSVPPNVFDDFELSGLSGSWCRGAVARVRGEMQPVIDELSRLREQAAALASEAETRADLAVKRSDESAALASQAQERSVEAEARAVAAEARAVKAEGLSREFELRAAVAEERARIAESTLSRRLLSAVRDGRLLSGSKRRVKSLLRLTAQTLDSHPTWKRVASAALNCVPPLKRRLRVVLAPSPLGTTSPGTPEGLSTDAAAVHRQLEQSQRTSKSA